MGLMQLLTVGRSLSEAIDRPHRYRMLHDRWPTFGHRAGGDGGATPAGMRHHAGRETVMKTETATGQNADVKQAYPHGRWTIRPNPFKSEKGVEKPASGSVQGELSLDKVKPVRNDLSDSDLELIPATPAPKAEEPNVFATPKAPEPKVGFLAKLKARFFRKKVG